MPGRAYVSNNGRDNVTVIDTSTNAIVGAPIPVGTGPVGVGVDRSVHRAYVANNGSNTVSVVNAQSFAVVQTITVGRSPQGVAVAGIPGASELVYVANRDDDTVSFRNPYLGAGEKLEMSLLCDPRTPPFATYTWDTRTHFVTVTAVCSDRERFGTAIGSIDDLARTVRVVDDLELGESPSVLRIDPAS